MKTINKYEQQANNFLTKTGANIEKKFLKFDYHFEGENQKRNIFEITISKEGKNMFFNFGSSVNDSCKKTPKINDGENEDILIFFGYKFKGIEANCHGTIKTNLFALREINEGAKDINELINDEYLNECIERFKNEILAYNKKTFKSKFDYKNPRIDTITEFRQRAIKAINEKIEELNKEPLYIHQKTPIIYPTNYDILAGLTKYDPGTFEDFCDNYGYDEDSRKAEKIYEAVLKEFTDLQTLFNDDELNELTEM